MSYHQVLALTAEADRLQDIHQDQAPQIQDKKQEIGENWKLLRAKVRDTS